jgi:hypothetical protein
MPTTECFSLYCAAENNSLADAFLPQNDKFVTALVYLVIPLMMQLNHELSFLMINKALF